jgi:hypothetical protein
MTKEGHILKRKMLSLGVALLLTVSLAGVAAANVPATEGAKQGFGRMMGGLVFRVADFLGMDVEEVREYRLEGQTLADILGNRLDEFVEKSVEERKAFLAELVEEGKITAAQAALCEEQMAERLNERLNSERPGCGEGNFAGPRMQIRKMMQRRMGKGASR